MAYQKWYTDFQLRYITTQVPSKMPISEETLARRHAARRMEIVERVLPVIGELLDDQHSFLDLPVDQILSRAGVSRTTFYRHFEDKNELLAALGAHALEDLRDAAMEAWQLPPDAPRSALEDSLRRSIAAYRPLLSLLAAMFEVATYDPAMKRQLQEGFTRLQRRVAQHLKEGQKMGFVRPGLHADEAAGWITWMAERGLHQLVADAGPKRAARLVESLADIIWYTAFDGQGRRDDIGR